MDGRVHARTRTLNELKNRTHEKLAADFFSSQVKLVLAGDSKRSSSSCHRARKGWQYDIEWVVRSGQSQEPLLTAAQSDNRPNLQRVKF